MIPFGFHVFGVGVFGVAMPRPNSLMKPRTKRAPKASEHPAQIPALAVAALAINRRRVMIFFFKLFLNRVQNSAIRTSASEQPAHQKEPPHFMGLCPTVPIMHHPFSGKNRYPRPFEVRPLETSLSLFGLQEPKACNESLTVLPPNATPHHTLRAK